MFYDNFKKLCENNNEKPTPVAQKLGCTSSNVALWKKGSVPRPAVLQKIADYFGVSTQMLLFGPDESIKNERPVEDRALTDKQKEAVEFIKSLSDDDLRRFIAAAKAMFGE